ncbi:ABC transporter ATP-binding protein [Roseburia sp. AM59-24XD]|jgi:ATP-binding cassette subfamily B multidrug efflux pump|uniref:ABC transporter ATP-binding protein n=1 Tax=Roseburia sp. AM59-24XD TaxID=2293138 RepID=UPI000E52F629|nr:ABC transporter ATP-binding protein [Roseburia sp. AM59-24XD]RHP84813.1 ABC transporter ATP-binding protein [Roseburia sp. AM59-24XD]
MKKLLKYITEYRKECILGPLFKLLEACFDLTVPLVMSWLIDRGISQNDVPYIWKMGGLLLILAAIGLTCSITAQYFAAKAAVGFATKLRHAVFKHIESLSFTEMDEAGTSMMITRMTSDINQVQSGTNLALRLFLRSPFIVFGAAVMAFTIDVKAALVFAVVIPLLALVVFGIMLITMPMYQKVQGHLDRLLGVTRQNLSGVRVIRAFNKEQAERESFGRENDLLTRMQLFVGRISALMNPVTYIMINGALVALIWTGAVRIDMGTLKQGQIVALINYMSQILVELVKMANTIIMSTKCVACGNRIQALLEVESSLEDGSQSFEENGQEVTPARVEFDHVSLTYKGAGGESLEDITFTAEPGKTIGIIGGTGSGKSSLVHMIPRFYDATEGSVRINGQDVKSYRMDDLRQHIGIVMQKAVLFHGTIRENIRWGAPEATDEQINEALELAQAAEVVAGKPEGLDYEIEQGGRNLSGGQRQRFTIARALVRKPSVLILDDSASALDFATDAKLRKALAGLKSTSTIFIVSQRTSSIQQADKILVLDDGKLVGMGTHEELLENCSVYKEIYDSQFKKPEETTPSQGKER